MNYWHEGMECHNDAVVERIGKMETRRSDLTRDMVNHGMVLVGGPLLSAFLTMLATC